MIRIIFLLLLSFSCHAQIMVGEAGIIAVPASTPMPTANLVLHYDMSVPTSIHTGTTTTIAQVDELNSGAHPLLQSVTIRQPIYNATAKTLSFNSQPNMATGAFTLNRPVTYYIVMKQVTWTTGRGLFDGNAVNSAILFETGSTPNIAFYAGTTACNNANLVLNTMSVVIVVDNGAGSTVSVNDGTKATGNPGASNPSGFTIGDAGGGGAPSNIVVQEIAVYSAADNATLQTANYNILKSKWGL